MEFDDRLDVEWLILADAAQINGNKLFLLGGGWNQLAINSRPASHHMAVAVSFRVPWSETNRKHSFEVQIADGDGKTLGRVPGQFEVGRPPGLPPGSPQRGQIAVDMTLQLETLGSYMITAAIDGREGRSFPFYVIPGPALAAEMQGEGNSGQE